MMRIQVRGFLTLKKIIGDQTVLDFEVSNITLNEFLHKLSDMFGDHLKNMIFDPETHAPGRHIKILINGRHYSHLPEKLNIKLRDGDEVALFPPIAGG